MKKGYIAEHLLNHGKIYGDASLLLDEKSIICWEEIEDISSNMILVTYKLPDKLLSEYSCVVVLPMLSIGLFSSSQIENHLFQEAFEKELLKCDISLEGIKNIASVALKKNEYAFNELAKKLNVPYLTYSIEEINQLKIKNPSQALENRIGAKAVAEPCAQLASEMGELLCEKKEIVVPSYKVFTYAISIQIMK